MGVIMVTKGGSGIQVFFIVLVVLGFTLGRSPSHYAIQGKMNQAVLSVEMTPYIAKATSTESSRKAIIIFIDAGKKSFDKIQSHAL